jgi:hypothetical protein
MDPPHGAKDLRLVRVDTYNAELEDPAGDGFLGDRASNRSFMAMLEEWRKRVHRGNRGIDPLQGTSPSATTRSIVLAAG